MSDLQKRAGLEVSEMFTSVQGEGVHAGRLMTFLRFFGCSCACPWCDSAYAREEGGHLTSYAGETGALQLALEVVRELSERFVKGSKPVVCLTGGEPTEQNPRLMYLFLKFLREFWDDLNTPREYEPLRVHVETNGSDMASTMLDWVDWVTVSPKPTTSEYLHGEYMRADELKYVLDKGEKLPEFLAPPKSRLLMVMPKTIYPFSENLAYNLESYAWAANMVCLSGGKWVMTGRLQEICKIR